MPRRSPNSFVPSMRPPHCAGEIIERAAQWGDVVLPSMRPPHCAGEIGKRHASTNQEADPSMRPPHCAGEIDAVICGWRGCDFLQ